MSDVTFFARNCGCTGITHTCTALTDAPTFRVQMTPPKHVCPKGHEQWGGGHCVQCHAEWLAGTFPTAPKEGT
jgi:hypothetical protein